MRRNSDIFQPQIRKNNTFQFTDNLAWVKGRHSLQFGADVELLLSGSWTQQLDT